MTVTRQINDMTGDIKKKHFRCTKFNVQIDESTDVTGITVLLVFFRCIYIQRYHDDVE